MDTTCTALSSTPGAPRKKGCELDEQDLEIFQSYPPVTSADHPPLLRSSVILQGEVQSTVPLLSPHTLRSNPNL